MSVPEGAGKRVPLGKVGDIDVIRNRSLRTSSNMPVASSLGRSDGGEQSVAQGGKVVIYTTNNRDAISFDGGFSFSSLDPTAAFGGASAPAGGFCCDQVVAYLPRQKRFVWVLQYYSGTGGRFSANASNVIRVATATLREVQASGGTNWQVYDFTPANLGFGVSRGPGKRRFPTLDRPHVATTHGYVYLTADGFYGGTTNVFLGSVIWRIPVRALGQKLMGRWGYDRVPASYSKVRPAQNASTTAQTQYFAGTASTTRLGVFKAADDSNDVSEYDVDVHAIANLDTSSKDPANSNWMSRYGKEAGEVVTGAKTGSSLVLGWMFGRKVKVLLRTKSGYTPLLAKIHDQPGLGFAVINTAGDTPRQVGSDDIEYEDFAAALPQLRANTDGATALSFMFGGPTRYPSHVVGFRNDYAAALTVNGEWLRQEQGGDYVGLVNIPGTQCFAAAGSATKLEPTIGSLVDPHYIVFGRTAAHCTVPLAFGGPPGPPPPGNGPDLVVQSIGGGFGSITVDVKNQGNQPAGASKLAYNFGGSDTLVDVGALNAGQSETAVVPCPANGTVTINTRADANNDVTETSESNNERSATINCHLFRPDLVVTAVRFQDPCCTISADVANIGNADAPATHTRITQAGQTEVMLDTPALAAGDSTTVSTQCVYGGTAQATADADALNEVLELDETNNSNSGSGGISGRCVFP